MNNRHTSPQSKATVQQKYDRSRHNLLLVIVFTLVNLGLVAMDSGVMFLFSASIPYISVVFGVVLGLPGLLTVSIVIATVSLGLYFLCWLLSKRHSGWLVAALIFFILDTLFLLGFYLLVQDFSGILDVLFHGLVLYHLAMGIRCGSQLKKWPEDPLPAPEADADLSPDDGQPILPDSSPIRIAETDVKCRVLLESEQLGHRICYRRVKRVNQLVIDNYIYAETEMLLERPHELTAVIGGRLIAVGLNSLNASYLSIDGITVASKTRLY